MKLPVLILFTFFLAATAYTQYPKHIIKLKDKANNQYTFSNASQLLSPRALQRRSRYNIKIDSADLPVSKIYVDSLRAAGSVTILSSSRWLNQVLIETTDQSALNKINSLPFVVSSQPVGRRMANPLPEKFDEPIITLPLSVALTGRTNADRSLYGLSFGQIRIHEGEYLHNKGYRGEGMQVTVLDAGFFRYRTLSAFDSMRMNGQVAGEIDLVAFDNSVDEDDSHGMYCLSIMAANQPGKMMGTAPKSRYQLIRTENAASEFPIEEHNWVVGAEIADSSGSDVISSSLGYYDFDDPSFNHSYNDFYKNTTMVTRGATIATKKGMIVMNSAGNEGNKPWKYLGFPADADSVCAVGAIDTLGNIGTFSSFGFPGKIKPNIVSVGVNTVIAGLNNQPAYGNGTSYASPNVAGLVTCLWQAFPQFNNMQILDAVYRSSNRYNNPDNRFGFGIPNFRIAYQLLEKQTITSTISFDNEWIVVAPNPFSSSLVVNIKFPESGKSEIRLMDAAGKTVKQLLVAGTQNQLHREEVNTASLASGIYMLQVITPNSQQVKKLLKH